MQANTMKEQENKSETKTDTEKTRGNFATLEDSDMSESLRQLKWSIIATAIVVVVAGFFYL